MLLMLVLMIIAVVIAYFAGVRHGMRCAEQDRLDREWFRRY